MNTQPLSESLPVQTAAVEQVSPDVKSMETGTGDFDSTKITETAKLESHLGVAKESQLMNIVNLVLAGLVVAIPAYMGVDALLQFMPISEESKSMARLGSMFALRPVVSKLTNIVNGKFLTPSTELVKTQLNRAQNSQAAQNLKTRLSGSMTGMSTGQLQPV